LYEGRTSSPLRFRGDLLGEFSLKRALTLMMSMAARPSDRYLEIGRGRPGGVHAASGFLSTRGRFARTKARSSIGSISTGRRWAVSVGRNRRPSNRLRATPEFDIAPVARYQDGVLSNRMGRYEHIETATAMPRLSLRARRRHTRLAASEPHGSIFKPASVACIKWATWCARDVFASPYRISPR